MKALSAISSLKKTSVVDRMRGRIPQDYGLTVRKTVSIISQTCLHCYKKYSYLPVTIPVVPQNPFFKYIVYFCQALD